MLRFYPKYIIFNSLALFIASLFGILLAEEYSFWPKWVVVLANCSLAIILFVFRKYLSLEIPELAERIKSPYKRQKGITFACISLFALLCSPILYFLTITPPECAIPVSISSTIIFGFFLYFGLVHAGVNPLSRKEKPKESPGSKEKPFTVRNSRNTWIIAISIFLSALVLSGSIFTWALSNRYVKMDEDFVFDKWRGKAIDIYNTL